MAVKGDAERIAADSFVTESFPADPGDANRIAVASFLTESVPADPQRCLPYMF